MSTTANDVSFLRVKRLHVDSILPARASDGAAGYDLSTVDSFTIPPGGKFLAPTGLSMAIPKGTYGRIAPRSGLAWKKMIGVGAGVIDSDYRGEVKVVLFNHSDEPVIIQQGDRIAQLILEKIEIPLVIEVKEKEFDDTVRGEGGFGSTGK